MNKARPPYDEYDDDYQDGPRPKKKSGVGKVFLILAIVFAVILGICCLSGVIFYYQGKDAMADAVSENISMEIDRSQLPPEQKTKIKVQVTRVQEGFKSGEISLGQVSEIFKGLAEGPMFPLAVIWEAFQKHIPSSHLDLSDSTRIYQRFARGAVEKSIPMLKVREVVKLVTNEQKNSGNRRNNNQQVIKKKMSEAEIDLFIETMTKAVEDADVPDEDYEVDIAKELKETVDKALKK